MIKILKWISGVFIILIILGLIALEIFDQYIATEKGARWIFAKVSNQAVEVRKTAGGLRYVSIGESEKQALLLIHGAPGSLFDWRSLAMRPEIYEKYRLIICERPGYGATVPFGKADPSILNQAERLIELIQNEKQKVVLMGHSYGAPIAVIMGALAENKIEKIYGVSGQYDPDNEIIFKVSYLINFKIFQALLPRSIWVSNVEKLTHPEGLREIEKLYPQVKVPTVLIHGDADSLVPYENSPWLLEKNPTYFSLQSIAGADHALQMQAVDYLLKELMKPNSHHAE